MSVYDEIIVFYITYIAFGNFFEANIVFKSLGLNIRQDYNALSNRCQLLSK